MKCERCGNDYPRAALKVDLKGNRLVCASCYDLIKTGKLVPEVKRAAAQLSYEEAREKGRKLALTTEERLERAGEKGSRYECRTCNYRFTARPDFKGKCPYCSADSVIPHMPESPTKEVDEMLG